MAISSAVSILEWRVMRQAGEKSRDGTTNADDAAPFSLREPSVKILRLSAGNEPNNSRKRDEARVGLETATFFDSGNLMSWQGVDSQGGEFVSLFRNVSQSLGTQGNNHAHAVAVDANKFTPSGE